MPITAHKLMPKTRAAIAAYDVLDEQFDAATDDATAERIGAELDAAKLAIGEAFAEETADRNPDRAQTAEWAAFETSRVRRACADIEGPDHFTWHVTTARRYHGRLGALPPAEQYRSAFLFGEAIDMCGAGMSPRFLAYRVADGVYYEGSRPITRAEFRALTAVF